MGMSMTFSGGCRSPMRATEPSISSEIRASLASVGGLAICTLQVDRRLPHFANSGERIASAGFLCDPFLLVVDDVEQQLLVFGRRHVIFPVLVVRTVIRRLAGLRVEFLAGPFSDRAVELDIGGTQLRFARFQCAVESGDQPRRLIAIKTP